MDTVLYAPEGHLYTVARGYESGTGRLVLDQTLDGAALAWAQHLETAPAERVAQLSSAVRRVGTHS